MLWKQGVSYISEACAQSDHNYVGNSFCNGSIRFYLVPCIDIAFVYVSGLVPCSAVSPTSARDPQTAKSTANRPATIGSLTDLHSGLE